MLLFIGVTFFYSGVMPILYIAAFLFFFLTYWVDKCLLLRCYRKPIKFDNYMAGQALSFFNYFAILHLVGFTVMFGFTPILPLRVNFESKEELIKLLLQFKSNLGQFTFYSIYIWVLMFILLYFVISFFFQDIIGCCTRKCRKKTIEIEKGVNFSDDFYQCISFNTLKDNFIRVQDKLQDALKLRQSGKSDKKENNRYIKLLKEQRNAVVSRISEIYKYFFPREHTFEVGEMIAALNEVD